MYNANQNEQEILKYWDEHKAFEKSVSERPEKKPYVFYDGPPFATGLPHYGHILSSVIKDVVPRYWTMKGFRVRRRWGWDCHGLPIENIVEKELKISGKKDIENKLGVDKFNEACRSKVLMYTKEWKKMIDRIGRWIEFDNAYKTMDSTYMESVWWALKTIWDKGLIYEGRKVLMYCPRCETPVSKAEIAMDNSYKDISEETVIVKFQITNFKLQINNKLQISNDKPVYILAWTTTPWTLPGNVALAVGKDIEYWVLNVNDENLIVAKDRVESVIGDKRYEIGDKVKGVDLIGLEYEPLFDIPAIRETGQKAWYVTEADFVTTVDGTGVVHTAVVYGEEDYNLGLKIGLPVVPLLDSKGLFNEYAPDLIRGQYFKKAEKIIKEDLEKRGLMFSKENFTHSYPHCWRCDTQLFYNALSAWFINIQKVKSKLIKNNEKVNWYPEHLKHGRFLNILETAPDWNISRNRFWATPLPFWKCECGHIECVGSVKELKGKAINFDEVYKTDKVEELDLHKHLADKIRLKCKKCGSHMSRIPEVVDCWVESASMPFAEFHYPFENKETFKKRFPGQYIAEYIAQTRAWFYYMHVMAGLLFDDISFKNVVCTGTILNEKGEKLSKSKMNYTDPWVIIERYGTDALRYYLLASPVMQADDLYFNDNEVKEVYNKVINLLWNVVEFYKMYSENSANGLRPANSANVLDKWIMARLNELVKVVTEEMDKYNTVKAGRPIKDFIDDLSTWYVRRSRDRFKIGNEEDKQSAIATLREVLLTLSKIMAPFTPFMAEKMYLELGGELESVHLEKWPQINDKMINDKLIEQMIQARKVVEMGLALRAEAGIKVRQPLSKFSIFPDKVRDPAFHRDNFQFSKEMMQIIADELNVKKVEMGDKEIGDKEIGDKEIGDKEIGDDIIVKEDGGLKVALHTEVTDELKKEGLLREVVRAINQIRKEQKLTISDSVVVEFSTDDELLKSVFVDFSEEIKKSVLASDLREGNDGEETEIDGRKARLKITKI